MADIGDGLLRSFGRFRGSGPRLERPLSKGQKGCQKDGQESYMHLSPPPFSVLRLRPQELIQIHAAEALQGDPLHLEEDLRLWV